MIDINRASAGSGKTYTLVREYLKFLLGKKQDDGTYRLDEHPHDNHRFILAITFTNKATDEMKKRIVDKLSELAETPDNSPYIKELTATLHSDRDKISASADIALHQLLEDYTNFNVSTIDTFFQKVLRTFAYEMDLASDYDVELNDEYVIAVGVNSLKTALRTLPSRDSAQLRSGLWNMIKQNLDEDKSWNIFSKSGYSRGSDNLYSFANVLTKENIKLHSRELYEYLENKENIPAFAKGLKDCIEEQLRAIKQCVPLVEECLNAPGVLPNGNTMKLLRNRLVGDNFDLKWLMEKVSNKKSSLEYLLTYAQEGVKVNKGSAPVDDERVRALFDKMYQHLRYAHSCQMVLNNINAINLLGDINAGIRNYTEENNVILLSGTNDIINQIINGCEMPFIYERLGMYLHNFLIDEFQDTSRMQWMNLKPLVAAGLDNGHDSLVIGDVKQSIYRFRNSDPELLHSQIQKDFKLPKPKNGESTNWRSAYNIINWNNAFFARLAKEKNLQNYYSDVRQEVSPKNRDIPGHVVIKTPFTTPDFLAETSGLDKRAEEAKFKELFEGWTYGCAIRDILDLLSRGYHQSDIAVLVNKNAEGAEMIGNILDYNTANPDGTQLKVVSEESLHLTSSAAVRKVINRLAMLDSCDRQEGRKKSSSSIIRLYESQRAEGLSASAALESAVIKLSRIASGETEEGTTFRQVDELNNYMELDSIVNDIIATVLTEEQRSEETPYLQALVDNVTDFKSRYGSDIHKFLKWWDSEGDNLSISSPADVDAITVMTIHKSKGLEFPCVLIPKFTWNLRKTGGLEWIATDRVPQFKIDAPMPPVLPVNINKITPYTIFSDITEKMESDAVMDSLNKTYVACTRASYELYLYLDFKSDLSLSTKAFIDEEKCDELERQRNSYNPDPNVVFELGNATRRANIPELNKEVVKPETLTMPPYRVKYDPKRWHFEVPDIVLEIRDTPDYRGSVMHKIMEGIRTVDDLPKSLLKAKVRGLITDEEMERHRAILTERLEDERVAPWFAPDNRLLLERTIIDDRKREWRADRIVIRPNGEIIIIDYKFGEHTDDTDKKYRRQVQNYINLVSHTRGVKADCVSGYIWYVHEGDIVKI